MPEAFIAVSSNFSPKLPNVIRMLKEGRTPLHTFRADIDFCKTEALTKVGILGIKVWICRGEVYGKRDLAPNFAQEKTSGTSLPKVV